MDAVEAWATETFGAAELKDCRRRKRLVKLAAAAARMPAGRVTAVIQTSAAREGAFRFLENERVCPGALEDAAGLSVASRAAESGRIFVAIDQTDLSFTDRQRVRGLGADNTKSSRTRRSAQLMNALAMDEAGIPLGLLAQKWWTRGDERAPHWKSDARPVEARESYEWVRTVATCEQRLRRTGADHRSAWYVCDRGNDNLVFLEPAVKQQLLFTVRAFHDRVVFDRQGRPRKLKATVRRQRALGELEVHLPRTRERAARRARCEVRATPVRIRCRDQWLSVQAVSVREAGYVAKDQKRIEWLLLTSHPAQTWRDAIEVVRSYTLRWRVEEFHKTWKSGACNVETSQLRSYGAIRRWATILAAVAARVERLKRLSRETPDVSALSELSQTEVDVAIALTQTKKHSKGDDLTLKEAVRLVAMVGGYMGRKGDGPPGSITIRRGLERVTTAAQAVELLGKSG